MYRSSVRSFVLLHIRPGYGMDTGASKKRDYSLFRGGVITLASVIRSDP